MRLLNLIPAGLGEAARLWRPAIVALGASALALVVEIGLWQLASGPLSTPPAPTPSPSPSPSSLTFDRLLTSTASVALALCVLWAWAATLATVGESLRALTTPPERLPRPPRGVRLPAGVRRWVLILCGVALSSTAAPALAMSTVAEPASAPATSIEALAATLPFPDRATDVSAPAHPRYTHIRVRPGESLWSITATRLGTADTDTVDRHWRELYRLNRSVIGDDPDRLRPGQRLLLPRSLG